MKLLITIECENFEEYSQISKLLEGFKKIPKRKLLSENEIQGIEDVKAIEKPGNRFIPLSKWTDYYPWPTIPALRNLAFFADTNGFKACIKRVGRRVIIDEKAFFEWVQKQ